MVRFSIRILFLLLLPFKIISPQGEWVKMNSPVTADLTCLNAYDSLNVWIAGDSGKILYSSDWGLNWKLQHSDGIYKITDLHIIDSLNGWGIGLNTVPPFTRIYYTSDGGNIWENFPFPDDFLALKSIYFLNSSEGYVAGSSGFIFKTTDNGSKWEECVVDSFRLDVNDIKFYDEMNGLACGGIRDFTGVVWKSTNAGEYWSAIKIPFEPVWELHYIDSLNIIGIGGDLEYGTAIIRSSDGGYVWEYNSLSIFGVGTSISFRSSNEVWCTLGSDLKLIFSGDSGKTWISITSPDNSALYDVVFADSLHGMAVGNNGAVYKYKAKTVDVKDDPVYLKSFEVYGNYPNPFNPTSKIIYNIPEAGTITIIVYNILGDIIYNMDEYSLPGKNYHTVNLNGLASGVYFYSIRYKNEVLSGKMVYLK